MPVFQLRYLDAYSRKVVLTRDFGAESDEAAITYANAARGLASMELWQGDRKIGFWEAFPPTS